MWISQDSPLNDCDFKSVPLASKRLTVLSPAIFALTSKTFSDTENLTIEATRILWAIIVFSEDELKQGNLGVHVKNVYMQANVNLENGEVNASGSIGSIKAYATNALSFSAIVVPQEIRKVTVVWNNVEYDLGFSQYCDKGKLYTLTATLKKTSGGISVTIGGWEDSGEDFGGTVQ